MKSFPLVSSKSSSVFPFSFLSIVITFFLLLLSSLKVVHCSLPSSSLSSSKRDTSSTDTMSTTTRTPTLPANGNIQIIFSDLDGTLVHFEKYYKPNGSLSEINTDKGTAIYKCHQENGSPYKDQTRLCKLMPTLTMGPGVISLKTIELINQLRSEGKVIFVYISGARKSTMLKRLPLLANADYAIAETGGRIYKLVDNDDGQTQTPILDDSDDWTRKIEEICGPIETLESLPLEQRHGLLWDWCRELMSQYNIPCDIRDYTCCFRVDCSKQPGSEEILRNLIDSNKLPDGISCATNLGKYDFFPTMSGKGNAVKYIMNKLGISSENAVALFDDENDIDMAKSCGHSCVMGCTHESIAKQIQLNPHWNVATQSGVFATEEMLQMLLEHVRSSSKKE